MIPDGSYLILIGIGICLFAPLIRIAQGIEYMTETKAQALADLAAAVLGISDAVSAQTESLRAALAKPTIAAAIAPDDSAEIEAQVAALNALAASLKASVATAAPIVAPVVAPVVASVAPPAVAPVVAPAV